MKIGMTEIVRWLSLLYFWILIFAPSAGAQPLKEIRIGSSDITVSNL